MGLGKGLFAAFPLQVVKTRKRDVLRNHLAKALKAYDINMVIDVGANRGQFASGLRALGYDGPIHSFEPVAATFEALSKAAEGDPEWVPHHLALGETAGEAVINVSAGSDFSSLLPSNAYGRERFEKLETAYQETIRIDTLDAVLGEELAQPGVNALLKMDTQGFDLQAFAGAQGALSNIACLLSEIAFIPIYDGAPHFTEALRRYEAAGFSVSGLYPVSRNPDLSVIEMDCVMVNRTKFAG